MTYAEAMRHLKSLRTALSERALAAPENTPAVREQAKQADALSLAIWELEQVWINEIEGDT